MSMSQLQQQNVPAAAAYTEYSVKVPPQSKQVTFNLRSGNQPVYWYMTTTNGSTPGSSSNLPQLPNTYNTIPASASRTIFGVLGGQTVYFQTPGTNQVLEVDYYADI
jgi:hypothetical protein